MADFYGKGYRGMATHLHATIVVAHGSCECCGEADIKKLQCAHIITRRRVATRTRLSNAFCLCSGCHLYFGVWPVEFTRFVFMKIGETTYDALKALVDEDEQPRWSAKLWKAEYLRLCAVAEERGVKHNKGRRIKANVCRSD